MARQVSFDIIIPPLGDDSIDCQLSQWLVSVGDFVKEGDPLVILETEKTAIELPAPGEGTLAEAFVFEGEEVIESERIGIIRADAYDEDNPGYDDDEEDDDEDDDEEDYDDDYDDDEEDYDDEDEEGDLDAEGDDEP